MKKITVEFDLTEEMEAALLELLPSWQQYKDKEGKNYFENMTPEELFQSVMQIGSWHTIWRHIKTEQFRQGLIDGRELIDDKELTIAQREETRQQAQKEGGAQ